MSNDFRLKTVTGAILLALLLTIAMPLAALAQDETNTPTPTLESSPTSADTDTPEPTAAVPSETPSSTGFAPTDTETPSETPTPDLSATATSTLTSETPTSTPTETQTPTITPTLGVPLQSSVFTTDEVVWCPASVASPVDGGMGCTVAFTSLSSLEAALNSVASVDGKVWIGTGYVDTTDVTFDEPNLIGKKLTIQGGWTTVGGTISGNSPVGHFLTVSGWGNEVTLRNVDVNAVNAGNNIGITATGKITLTNVNSTFSTSGTGATLNNTSGAGDVMVSASTFSANVSGCGLVISSKGTITVNAVTASSNNGCGLDLDNQTVIKPVTVTNSTMSFNNAGWGLQIVSKGLVTVTNVSANNNSNCGLFIYNKFPGATAGINVTGGTFNTNLCGVAPDSYGPISVTGVTANSNSVNGLAIQLVNPGETAAVTVSGGTFNTNVNHGVQIATQGNITVTGMTANDNGDFGLILGNNLGTGNVTLSTGTFNLNDEGLYVTSAGIITLSNITSNDNSGGDGAYIDNTYGTGGVTVSNISSSSNAGKGISLLSKGVITLTNLTANLNNGTAGVNVSNTLAATPKNVTLGGVNEFLNNRETGLAISTQGSITTNDITALGNGIVATTGNGVSLINTFGPNPGLGVTLNGTNYLSGNYHHGVVVNSYGPIKLNNAFANSNQFGYGAYLINNSATTAQSVTLTGTSQFNYNSLTGLLIQSHGAVMLNNITANGSATGQGASITNDYAPFTAGVTLTGANVFLENSSSGIEVDSRGAIAASNVTANDNGAEGVDFNNTNAATNMAASLSGVNSAVGNFYENVYIASNGVISVASVTANESVQGNGMFLVNTNAAPGANKGVNISGINVANGNGQSGVQVQTHGSIVATTISASGNGAFGGAYRNGIYFANATASMPQPVTLNGTNTLNGNTQEGLEILSDGIVKINSVTANGNVGLGLAVDNTGSSAGSVTLTGANSFVANALGGVQIDTTGPIALNNVSADGNASSHGISLTNTYSGAGTPKNVTLTGINTANGNWKRGLDVGTYGDISVASLSANGNGVGMVIGFGEGAGLDNFSWPGATGAKKITLTGTNSFSSNWEEGADLRSRGGISLNNVTASGNDGGYGVYAFNAIGGGGVGVTLTGINTFNDNAQHGLYVNSDGPIAASSLRASGNLSAAHQAIYLFNANATIPQNVTVSGVNIMTNNIGTGVFVFTKGTVAVASLTSTGSANGYGLYIDNETSGTANVPKSVTLTGTNNISSNALTGLDINTYGPVSIAALTASNNGGVGADIDNISSSVAQAVTFTGLGYFVDNDSGLIVNTKGAISSSLGLTAINNTNTGVFLYNASVPLTPTDVTLGGTNKAIGNGGYGFRVISNGTISANNMTATGNTSQGVDLDNNDGSIVKDLKLTGTNVVSGNTLTNIYLFSHGAISVNNLTASSSVSGSGAEIGNDTEGKGITFTGNTYFNLNDDHGALVSSLGAISGNNMNASLNGQSGSGLGLQLINDSAGSPRTITLTGTNVFIDNDEEGLGIYSKGVVTLNNVRAHLNSLGLLVDNDAGIAAVNLTGINSFRNNANFGLRLRSLGAMTVNKLTVENNGSDGMFVDLTTAALNVMCGTFTANTGQGLEINTSGAVKLVGVVAAGNASPQVNFVNPPFSLVTVRACP